MHTNMINLTQIRMTFLLSNILLSDHNSDLTLPKCQLVYNIMEQIGVHVAQLISDVIHQFIGTEPPRHPVDPKKSNKALQFPASVIGLY